jgi:adenylate kinase family enzyme
MPHSAILLLGPTGSGKTPLGERIVAQGLWGRSWAHFDFGAQMRQLVARARPDEFLTQVDLDFLARVLHSGALLEDEQFPLSQRIFQSFLACSKAAADTWLVLNGLPRHVGQAEAMNQLAAVLAVVELAGQPEVIATRIGSNVGGDRTGRPDDQPEAVRRKLDLYARRTEPLVAYYRQRSVPVLSIEVTTHMTDAEMFRFLEAMPP